MKMKQTDFDKWKVHKIVEYVKSIGLEHDLHDIEERGLANILADDFGFTNKFTSEELTQIMSDLYSIALSNELAEVCYQLNLNLY